ncbi:MAG: hypothetical protein JWL61_5416 [Gemmatimonadetes bacterium]|nr:hypothetical protein [Gemmatimonadota bacterium]
MSDARVKCFWTQVASVGSRSTFYALGDLRRPHVPSVSQLREMADLSEAAAFRMLTSVRELRDVATEMAEAERNVTASAAGRRKAGVSVDASAT